MDIIGILKEAGETLNDDELAMLIEQLDMEEYTEAYKNQAKELISEIRHREMRASMRECYSQPVDRGTPSRLSMTVAGKKVPQGNSSAASEQTPLEKLTEQLNIMRISKNYKREFREFIKANPKLDPAFIDAHFTLFNAYELNTMLSLQQMGEEFLEKYIDVLDLKTVSRYQVFSEAFFMKHFSKLDPALALTKGKNEWRRKEKRSSKLDVFLRLKGVRL